MKYWNKYLVHVLFSTSVRRKSHIRPVQSSAFDSPCGVLAKLIFLFDIKKNNYACIIPCNPALERLTASLADVQPLHINYIIVILQF